MFEPARLVALTDIGSDGTGRVGAKAARLGILFAKGLPVPPGVCVPTGVYDEVVGPVVEQARQELGLTREMSPEDAERLAARVRAAVRNVEFPPVLAAELAAAAADLDAGVGVAVRSSGTAEDAEGASWAGQYSTTLRAAGAEEVLAAVRDCWASLWSPEAVAYRAGRGAPGRMAVLIQRMVEARAAGVMFMPATPDGTVVVEAVWGTGERLVDGTVTPEHHELVPGAPPGPGGSVLDAGDLAELTALGGRVRDVLVGGQDIEWAWEGRRLHLLQARPITADVPVARAGRWESPVEGAAWARISICDSWLPEPLSPLFATTLFPALVDRWTANWAGSDDNPLVPRPMHGTIEGYAYLRIDFPLNRHPWLTVKLIHSFFRFHLSPVERRWREDLLPYHRRRVAELSELDLTARSPAALLELVDELTELSARYWAIIGGLAWYWNVGEWVLARVFPAARMRSMRGADPDPPTYTSLLQGRDSLAHQAECALHALAAGHPEDLEPGLREYGRRFGHQAYHLDIAEPTSAENLAAVREAVDAYRNRLTGDPRERRERLERRSREVLGSARRALRRAPLRRRLLDGALRWSEHWSDVRDRALHDFTLAWPLIRAAHLQLGRRLVAEGALPAAEDVFFLTGDELRAWSAAPGQTDTGGWAAAAHRRAAEREERRGLTPPVTVPPDVRVRMGPWDITALALFGQGADAGSDAELRGSGVSAGRVRGRVRLLRTVQEARDVTVRDVLVIPHLTPAWSTVIARAGAVVTDLGGSLSHGSIVARELGVPAVMGTGNATKILVEGQLVDVDGGRGVVMLTVPQDGGR